MVYLGHVGPQLGTYGAMEFLYKIVNYDSTIKAHRGTVFRLNYISRVIRELKACE